MTDPQRLKRMVLLVQKAMTKSDVDNSEVSCRSSAFFRPFAEDIMVILTSNR